LKALVRFVELLLDDWPGTMASGIRAAGESVHGRQQIDEVLGRLELSIEGPAALGLIAVGFARDDRAVGADAGGYAASRRRAGARWLAGCPCFRRAGGLLAFQGLGRLGLRRGDLDGRGLLNAQEVRVLDDDGARSLEALAPGLFLLGQLGQGLRAEGSGQPQNSDE
jgi:hypothetical protein